MTERVFTLASRADHRQRTVDDSDEAVLVFQLGYDRASPRPCATRTGRFVTPTAQLVRPPSTSVPMTASRVATPPSAPILGLLNLLAAAAAAATVRLHPRFEPRRDPAPDRERTYDNSRWPWRRSRLAMAKHPRLEAYDLSSLRYVMLGRHPGE